MQRLRRSVARTQAGTAGRHDQPASPGCVRDGRGDRRSISSGTTRALDLVTSWLEALLQRVAAGVVARAGIDAIAHGQDQRADGHLALAALRSARAAA